MNDELRHRGPDGSGSFVSPDGRVAFEHRRLAIIDLSEGGAQPMSTADGKLTICFNGEIYNYVELKEDLAAVGASFRSDSDTEVILEGYRRFGVDIFSRLRGMFSLALADWQSSKIILARDRLGIKPMFFSDRNGVIAFCSEVDPLRNYVGASEIEPSALGHFLRYRYVSGPATIWRGIRRLLPGHYISIDLNTGATKDVSYWNLYERIKGGKQAAKPAEFEDRFATCIEQHIRADVPVGVLLSGGLDSTAVLRTLRRRNPDQEILTFSVGFGSGDDELDIARATARIYGTKHHEIQVSQDNLESSVDALARHYGEPLADSSAIPLMRLSEEVSKHVKVALGGDGGDELFGGYRWYQAADMVSRVPSLPFASALGTLFARRPAAWRIANALELEGQCRFDYLHGASFLPEELAALTGNDFRAENGGFHPDLPEHERLRLYDLETFTVDSVLYKVDVATMAYGLEVRVPMLDHELVEWAMKLPRSVLYSANSTKKLLRELNPPLPPQVLSQQKKGFSLPLRDWGESIKALANRMLPSSSAVESGFLRGDEVRRILNSETPDQLIKLWTLTVFESWYRSRFSIQ
jgi:asparagine synthase (glutamine-hydrolysing)